MNKNNLKQINNLIDIIGKFKEIKRRGFVLRQVAEDKQESDADHSFSVALLVLLLTPKHLNKERCLELALIHDLPEVYTGDFVPGEIEEEKKMALEIDSAKKIVEEINADVLVNLFDEYIQQETAEAKFVSSLDKLDSVLMSKYYDDNNYGPTKLLEEFAATAIGKIEKINSDDNAEIYDIINSILQENRELGEVGK